MESVNNLDTELGPLFLAVELDEETKSLLAQRLALFGSVGRLAGRLSRPENWHITVQFLGNVEAFVADRIVSEIDQNLHCKKFRVRLDGFGTFPNSSASTVLWVGVHSEGLIDLVVTVKEILTAVGVKREKRPYVPHLTLSRIRPPQDCSEIVADGWGKIVFWVRHLTLFQSCRPRSHRTTEIRYEVVERFDLQS